MRESLAHCVKLGIPPSTFFLLCIAPVSSRGFLPTLAALPQPVAHSAHVKQSFLITLASLPPLAFHPKMQRQNGRADENCAFPLASVRDLSLKCSPEFFDGRCRLSMNVFLNCTRRPLTAPQWNVFIACGMFKIIFAARMQVECVSCLWNV